MSQPDARFKCSPDAVSRDVQGEEVILDLSSGRYFGLDPVGSAAWRLLSRGLSRSQIQGALLEEFDVEAPRLARDLDELIAALRRRGLLVEV